MPVKKAQTNSADPDQPASEVFPVCCSYKLFMNFSHDNQHFIWEQIEKSVQNFRTLFNVLYFSTRILFSLCILRNKRNRWYLNILRLLGQCKGGTSWMRNSDWSTLVIGSNWKWGGVLFESNCIIPQTQNIWFNAVNASKITTFENVCLLVNICMETSSVGPDQTAYTGAVLSWSTLFAKETSNISADDQSILLFMMCTLRVNKC